MNNALPKLAAKIAKAGAIKHLEIQGPPTYGDVLHDGLVGSGKAVGSALGGAAGWWGGRVVGGSGGAAAGMTALGSLGHHAGGWAGHIAYLQGPVIKEILSHPENFTVDAAGAIVPLIPPADPTDASSEFGALAALQQQATNDVRRVAVPRDQDQQNTFDTGAPSISFLSRTNAPAGLPGLLSQVGLIDPHFPYAPAEGGLIGLIEKTLSTDSARQ